MPHRSTKLNGVHAPAAHAMCAYLRRACRPFRERRISSRTIKAGLPHRSTKLNGTRMPATHAMCVDSRRSCTHFVNGEVVLAYIKATMPHRSAKLNGARARYAHYACRLTAIVSVFVFADGVFSPVYKGGVAPPFNFVERSAHTHACCTRCVCIPTASVICVSVSVNGEVLHAYIKAQLPHRRLRRRRVRACGVCTRMMRVYTHASRGTHRITISYSQSNLAKPQLLTVLQHCFAVLGFIRLLCNPTDCS